MNAKELYYNVPSAAPISKMHAYREAVKRFSADKRSARIDRNGITYQGEHGATQYVEWETLPPATKW